MLSTVSRISISDWCEATASSRAKEAEPGRTGREGGVSRDHIVRLETGTHDPPLSRVEQLATALRVKV